MSIQLNNCPTVEQMEDSIYVWYYNLFEDMVENKEFQEKILVSFKEVLSKATYNELFYMYCDLDDSINAG